MTCLENLVKIWDTCSAKESGLYINDLPGFDLSFPDYLATEQVEDSMQLLTDKRRMASEFLKHEILSHLNPRSKMGSVLSGQTAGFYDEDREKKAAQAGLYKGIQLTIENYPYLQIYVDTISVFIDDAITTNILVYDLTTGLLLDTLPITTVANQPTLIQVGKTYQNKGQYLNLGFLIDASLADSYETNITGSACVSCFSRLERLSAYCGGRGVKIASAGTINNQNLQGETHTNGISLQYSVQCDHEYFVCNIANRLALPMWYRFGIELMDEVIYSKRLNSLTTIHKEDAVALKAEYQIKYDECLKGVLQNLQIPNNICYNCTPFVSINTRIP